MKWAAAMNRDGALSLMQLRNGSPAVQRTTEGLERPDSLALRNRILSGVLDRRRVV
jgi:hypothetical protein